MPTVELTKEQLGAILLSLDIRANRLKSIEVYDSMTKVALTSIQDAKAALLSHIQPEAPYLGE